MSPWPAAIVIGVLIAYGCLCVAAWVERRANRQIQAEQQMRRGFKAACRQGWLPEDTQ